jgi:hypothetical protein
VLLDGVDGWQLAEYAWIDDVGHFTYEHEDGRVEKLTRPQP